MAATTPSTQPAARLKSLLPVLEWLPNHNKARLRGDIIAAITVWALLVPKAMAYAGMPPEAGLEEAIGTEQLYPSIQVGVDAFLVADQP